MKSVYNYDDPISYIKDYVNQQKASDHTFSLRKWSTAMDFKSPTVLIDILNRKRKLRGQALKLLMKGLPIDNAEKMYFHAMAERSLSENDEKTKMYDLLLKELTPYKTDHYSSYRNEGNIDIYSHWIYMAILSMTSLNHFELTVENIKSRLCEELEVEFIENALFQLFENGFLKKEDSGKVICPYTSCTTKTDAQIDKNVSSYYTVICDLAKQAIHYTPEKREFQCFSVAIPRENIPLAKEIVRKARAQLVSLGSDKQNKNDVVYQGNLMLFPLTK